MYARGTTVLLTTHHMEEAERLCDRVAIVDHGRIVASDSPRGLIDTYFAETAIVLRRANPSTDELRRLPGVSTVSVEDGEVTLSIADVPATMSALFELAQARSLPLEGLYVRGATLEDVFLKVTGGG